MFRVLRSRNARNASASETNNPVRKTSRVGLICDTGPLTIGLSRSARAGLAADSAMIKTSSPTLPLVADRRRTLHFERLRRQRRQPACRASLPALPVVEPRLELGSAVRTRVGFDKDHLGRHHAAPARAALLWFLLQVHRNPPVRRDQRENLDWTRIGVGPVALMGYAYSDRLDE